MAWSLTSATHHRHSSRPMPTDGIAALVDHFAAGAAAGRERNLAFIPWGGAYNRVSPSATAFPHRQELFTLKHSITVDAAAPRVAERRASAWLSRSWSLAHRWGSGGVFPNLADPDIVNPAAAYFGVNLGRLAQVKARYNPEDFFRSEIEADAPQPSTPRS